MSGITPCLWFDGNAEEAAKFYVSLLPQQADGGKPLNPSIKPA
jgi:predicted 3-demethylubiquinone-9 3-methyltransferase (glyoxalase superfamily)